MERHDPCTSSPTPSRRGFLGLVGAFLGGNLAGLEDVEGIEIADPGLVQQPDGTYRYSEASPLRYNLTTRPLDKSDVGPTWAWT
ncbi:hypothetical protein [Parenemella sanctibonifatiensis]|uniref:Uncharacterized protein n=1 Tax=Parenemella sanctibonifatiensis TaxID=2016505 RepID=A0A255EIV3_9ACTN|nr:hypothetical protein [Parenemella sanctibonifatiensis]OYN86395.1 hypothetical protein CGZ92_08545 [Parenemella sanctibonifatiensis]OYN91170.1 hypothetical protein CGZ91_06855 [Parenemella sanctibonifatiensis]